VVRTGTPLALRRDGALVGLLMPMSVGWLDFAKYDFAVEPMDLGAAVTA
jgi:hypothetical protein